jgi:2-phospho-L-lactate/phosphoenolpyruvate guanylyltransferase
MITAVVPVKATKEAKQRLAGLLSSAQRQALALAMVEDVLATLAAVREIADILVVTVDPAAAAVAARYGAEVTGDGARDGHTGAVAAAARRLAGGDLLQVPGDIPLVEPADLRVVIAAHDRERRAFTIVPARDQRGSNAVLCSPAGAVPLRFGENSFFPHLAAARACGIEPRVVRLPRIALDIDTPDDLALLRATSSRSRASALLESWHLPARHGIEASA